MAFSSRASLIQFTRQWANALLARHSLRRLLMLVTAIALVITQASVSLAAPVAQSTLLPPTLDGLQVFGASREVLIKEVPVTGQPFDKALRIDTFGKDPRKIGYGLRADINGTIKAGDVLLLSFMARRIDSTRESGEAMFSVSLDQMVDGKSRWPAHLDRGVSIGSAWTPTSIPFVMSKDVTPADVRFMLRLDKYEQSFELGPVTLVNYGSSVKLADMPRSVVRYEGDEPNAKWRQDSLASIEKIRKGDLVIAVTNKKGQPVQGAQVEVRMTRNAFNWGTAVNSKLINGESTDSQQYKDKLIKYFNQIVFENEGKYKVWARQDPQKRGVETKKAVQWLRKNNISTRHHVLVWPSWRQTPQLEQYKNDPVAMRKAISDFIEEQTTFFRGDFDEWDVLNEATRNHDVMDMLGNQEMLEWFKLARAKAPGVKLFYNDFTMFITDGKETSQQFYNLAKYLKDNGAPMDAFAEQAHIGGTPPGIPFVLERFDHFATLGVPVQISEFDIRSNDDEYKARYLTDFVIAVYGHPSMVGFVQWGFWAGEHWSPESALWDEQWNIRKHGQAYVDLVTKTFWTNSDLKTNEAGLGKTRGFTGQYRITVRDKRNVLKTTEVELTNKGAMIAIQLDD
jgi:endo-1,4-beta-xylanase